MQTIVVQDRTPIYFVDRTNNRSFLFIYQAAFVPCVIYLNYSTAGILCCCAVCVLRYPSTSTALRSRLVRKTAGRRLSFRFVSFLSEINSTCVSSHKNRLSLHDSSFFATAYIACLSPRPLRRCRGCLSLSSFFVVHLVPVCLPAFCCSAAAIYFRGTYRCGCDVAFHCRVAEPPRFSSGGPQERPLPCDPG